MKRTGMIDYKYIRFYLKGYLNMYYSDYAFSYNPAEGTFIQHRLRKVLSYMGWKGIHLDLVRLAPILSIAGSMTFSMLVLMRFIAVMTNRLFTRQTSYDSLFFIASLIFAPFRMKKLLESVRPLNVCTLKIPFIHSTYNENVVNILTCISYSDIVKSFISSWITIWTLYRKYRKRDPLFRSYSSFEFYLTCCFVQNTEKRNKFIFYNTYDRWAFLMCDTSYSTFIQHGSIPERLSFIKIGTPHTAFFINEKQKKILVRTLFKGLPAIAKYRSHIEFSENEMLRYNGKKNVLLVCWNKKIDKEWKICELLYKDVNLYIKPHPADRDNPEYNEMSGKYGCIIIPKSGYPQVDLVISYESTLADEYEDVGVKVVRYDLLDALSDVKKFI